VRHPFNIKDTAGRRKKNRDAIQGIEMTAKKRTRKRSRGRRRRRRKSKKKMKKYGLKPFSLILTDPEKK